MKHRRAIVRNLSLFVLLVGMAASVFLFGGCSSVEKRDEVWIRMVPSVRYTFESPRAYVKGDKIIIRGWVVRQGHFDTTWASLVVIGRNKEGEVAVKQPSPVRMTSRRESFVARAPFKPDLDWTIEIEEGGGLLNRATRKVFDR